MTRETVREQQGSWQGMSWVFSPFPAAGPLSLKPARKPESKGPRGRYSQGQPGMGQGRWGVENPCNSPSGMAHIAACNLQ